MIDRRTRPVAQRLLLPTATACPVTPHTLTAIGFGLGLGAAAAASASLWTLAVLLWLANRFFDGLDGAVARVTDRQSDIGGYLDSLADATIYAAVPLGIALARHDEAVWIATAALLATFYLNATSWLYLSALLEKRSSGASLTGESTSVTMPAGLIEGAETIAFFTVMLVVPSQAAWTMSVMAVGVAVTVVSRVVMFRNATRGWPT